MRSTIVSLAILLTVASCYSVEASLENAAHHIENSGSGARRNSSLLPDIVLPSISSAQSSVPAVARPIPQAVSYPVAAADAPAAQSYYTPQPAAQGYTAPPQAAVLPNYTPQQQQQAAAAPVPYYYTPQVQQPAATVPATPKLTLPTLIQPPKEKEDDNDDSDDEDEEDEDEEDEEDYDADDLVTRRRRR
ncbi:unnamed protein product [Mucor fragilis]